MLDIENAVDSSATDDEFEEIIMGLIINSGQARSVAYGALKKAKEGDFDGARKLMEQSREALNEAHKIQTRLISDDQGVGKTKVSLVLVHAQDHLMTSMLARELVTELIELHEKIK
ncbi:PTS N,N'-diacetylchitobiose transporter subunit IIA [Proteus mirabilis]|nr:PTS N,N'-diacetylchitobiose transporter subunit IIA [Proteus mirabilis]